MSAPQHPAPQYPSQTPGGAAAPPLWAPYYGAPFMEAVRRVFKKYATFTGRASRAEYWWWALVGTVVGVVLNVLIGAGMETSTDAYTGSFSDPSPGPVSAVGYLLSAVWGLGVLVPSLALTVRRLHDVNLSGWLLLLGLVPFLGGVAVLVMALLPPNPAGQRFDQPQPDAYSA